MIIVTLFQFLWFMDSISSYPSHQWYYPSHHRFPFPWDYRSWKIEAAYYSAVLWRVGEALIDFVCIPALWPPATCCIAATLFLFLFSFVFVFLAWCYSIVVTSLQQLSTFFSDSLCRCFICALNCLLAHLRQMFRMSYVYHLVRRHLLTKSPLKPLGQLQVWSWYKALGTYGLICLFKWWS